MMRSLAEELFEEKSEKNKRRAEDLLTGDRIAENDHRAENGEELSSGGEDRTRQGTEPFDGEKDEILQRRERKIFEEEEE